MLDAVVECLVERRYTAGTYIARLFMFSLDALLIVISLFILFYIPDYIILICLLVGFGWLVTWLVFRYTKVEFEYSFFDDELTIDKIYNKSKRKRIGRFALSRMEYMTPSDSPRLQGKQKDNVRILDCSARDSEIKDYTLYIMEDDKRPVMLTISPNEELMNMFNKKYSRKITE